MQFGHHSYFLSSGILAQQLGHGKSHLTELALNEDAHIIFIRINAHAMA
jgi:hypothetical protein